MSFRSTFHDLEERPNGLLALKRSAVRFARAGDVDRERVALGIAFNRIGRAGRRVLIDLRDAPTDTAERWAEEFRRLRLESIRGLERVALLVRTKVGTLQAERLMTEDGWGDSVRVFDDRARAEAFLLAPGPRPSRRSSVPPFPRAFGVD